MRIKNTLGLFETAHLEAIGSAIGKCCSACKIVEKEGLVEMVKMETDLIGEERKKPKLIVELKKAK